MNKNRDPKHIYQEDFSIGIEYHYDNTYKKIYDIQKLKRKIKIIIETLENKK